MSRNPTYYPGDLRAALVDAAVEILREDGLAGLSLRAAARRAGVSHAAPAHHVGDRAGLLAAVAVRGHEELAARMVRATSGVRLAPDEMLAAGVLAYVAFAEECPELFQPMFRRELWAGHEDEVDAVLRRGYAALREVVVAAQGRGWSAGTDPDAATVLIWSVGQGLATLREHGALEGLPVDVGAVVALVTTRAETTPRVAHADGG